MSKKGWIQRIAVVILAVSTVYGVVMTKEMVRMKMAKQKGAHMVVFQDREKRPSRTGTTRYVWYIKSENGVKYKRLYDTTYKKWITDKKWCH